MIMKIFRNTSKHTWQSNNCYQVQGDSHNGYYKPVTSNKYKYQHPSNWYAIGIFLIGWGKKKRREIYTILRPLSINRLFFLACLSISAASTSSFSDVEVRKLVASPVPLVSPKLSLISFIAPVVLYIVSDAPFAVRIIMFTTVFASEWNLAVPPRAKPDAALQGN